MKTRKIAVIYTTCPDEAVAEQIAHTVIDERLAACANSYAIKSCYRWEGAFEQDDEIALWCKTTTEAAPELMSRIAELHPYDIPAILSNTHRAALPYARWVESQVSIDL